MMSSIMQRHMHCPKCNRDLSVTFPTCCIASGCRIACRNKWCDFVDIEQPTSADIPLAADAGSALIERNTDYAVNILYVLGFLSSGDGGQKQVVCWVFLVYPTQQPWQRGGHLR